MIQQNSKAPKLSDLTANADEPLLRSGAAAYLAQIPVATLRVWERRYRVGARATSASGQRLYCAADVRRLALIKQLIDQGHAIGRLAALAMNQLQAIAATHTKPSRFTRPGDGPGSAKVASTWRVAVIGAALAQRLQHPGLVRQLHRPIEVLGVYDSAVQAAEALISQNVDALLIHAPSLQAAWLADFEFAAPALTALPKAVLYGFATDSVCQGLAAAGIALQREPQSDCGLGQWLRSLSTSTANPALSLPPRRWDDVQLAQFATLSTAVACECPRHIAELLLLLSHFETYSDECENRNAADAALHVYLKQVAAGARLDFETALQRIALHEGLVLPL